MANLRTDRLIHESPASINGGSSEKAGNGPAEAIVVKGEGSVAWIAADGWHPEAKPPERRATTYQVRKIDRTGQHRLAMGPQIVPNSIALAGNTVYWGQRQHPRTGAARLIPACGPVTAM